MFCCVDESSQAPRFSMVFEVRYPMYVVRAEDVLKMTEVRRHQQVMADGLLDAFEPWSGIAVFVSHQWTSRAHPDPEFKQFPVLQTAMRCARDRSLGLEPDPTLAQGGILSTIGEASELSGLGGAFYLWYDFFAIPQLEAREDSAEDTATLTDLGRAVASIPAYVERSRHFIILAPDVAHVEVPDRILGFTSWKSRGWCRVERAARVLAADNAPMFLARGGNLLFEVACLDYMWDPVGEGCFSVESDREKVLPTMLELVDAKLDRLLRDGKIFEFRALRSRRPLLLRGLPLASPQGPPAAALQADSGDVAAAFLEAYAFPRNGGRSPQAMLDEALLLAAAVGDAPVVKALLDRGANAEANELVDAVAFGVFCGQRPLHHAAASGHMEVASCLLERRAQLNARDKRFRSSVLDCAAISTCPALLRMLVQGAADIRGRSWAGISAMGTAAAYGRLDNVQELLSLGARAGFADLLFCVQRGGGDDAVRALLEAPGGPDPNRQLRIAAWPLLMSMFLQTLPHRLWGGGGFFALYNYHTAGATPLHFAALVGNVAGARALLRAGARDDIRSDRGATAADLAALIGMSPEHQANYRRIPDA